MGFSWQAYAYLLLHAVCQYPMSRAHYMVKHKPKLWRGAQCPACSAQFICSVVADSLRPHELQHARPPCPSGRMFSFPYVQPQNCYFTPCLGTGMFDTISNILTPGVHVWYHFKPYWLPESTQIHVHRAGDAIQPSHPLSSPSPPAPNLSPAWGQSSCIAKPLNVIEQFIPPMKVVKSMTNLSK